MASIHEFTKDKINAAIEAVVPDDDEHRGYLGMSQLGHECDRKIWYIHKKAPRDGVFPRTKRIWEHGHWEEQRVIDDLRRIGCKVYDEQKEIVALDGMVRGHIDGIVEFPPSLGVSEKPHLLEVKTFADTYYKNYAKKGVKSSNFEYFVQAQMYAGHLKLPRILFAGVNKNTEERCFERIHTETKYADKFIIRAAEIIIKEEAPDRIGGVEWYQCKLCSFKGVCHG